MWDELKEDYGRMHKIMKLICQRIWQTALSSFNFPINVALIFLKLPKIHSPLPFPPLCKFYLRLMLAPVERNAGCV